jgi:hypothetical protein
VAASASDDQSALVDQHQTLQVGATTNRIQRQAQIAHRIAATDVAAFFGHSTIGTHAAISAAGAGRWTSLLRPVGRGSGSWYAARQ